MPESSVERTPGPQPDNVRSQIKETHSMVLEIHNAVFGSRAEQHRGLMMRVRELEQAENKRRRITWTAATAAIGAAATSAWFWITNKPPQ